MPMQATTIMLKPHFDKDSVSSHSVNIVYSVPFEDINCKIQIEDENFVKSDPGLAKLQNSDILRNLEQKLSHLDLSQNARTLKINIGIQAVVFRCSYCHKQNVSRCRRW